MTPPSREYSTGLAEAGRAQEEDISYTGIGKRLPLRLVSKDEQASAKEGAEGIQGGVTLEGNVWGNWGSQLWPEKREHFEFVSGPV